MQLGLQHVGLDYVDNLLLLRLCEREKVIPLGVLVADKAPVDPRREVENVNECREEVNETAPSRTSTADKPPPRRTRASALRSGSR